MARAVQPKNSDIIALVEDRFKELRADVELKHKENADRRHKQASDIERVDNKHHELSGRVGVLERDMRTVVGESGGSGLLHQIRDSVGELKQDLAIVKQTIQDTPAIRKWVYGAMAVIAFIIIVVPMMLTGIVVAYAILRYLILHH